MPRSELVASFRCFGLSIFDEVCFIEDDSEKVQREKATMRAAVAAPSSDLVELR